MADWRYRHTGTPPDTPADQVVRLSVARQRFRQGPYRLHASRWHPDRFMIFDTARDVIAAGADFTLTLDQVEAWLRDHASARADRG